MDTANELIQWPRAKYWDRAWNPVVGCRPCSPACENCYAKAWAARFHRSFAPHATSRENPPRSGVVFCGNMTDLFGVEVTPLNYTSFDDFSSNATYLWLTKRASNMAADLGNASRTVREGDHYFGFTAENQEWYDRRRDAIYDIWPSWANLWLSCEPLLGDIDLKVGNVVAGHRLNWLVVGCESGPNRRPCKLEWVESIVDQCRSAGVPVFVKQLDIAGRCVTDINKFPEHLRIRQVPWEKKGKTK